MDVESANQDPEVTPEVQAETTPPASPAARTPVVPVRAKKRRPRDAEVLRAFRAGIPVDGTIERVIKGGYEVRVGKVRGFCPHSQIDVHRVDDPEPLVGKTFSFRIIQVRRGGEDVVLSRRAVLDEARTDEAKAVRATLIEGHVMEGRIARTADFGVFVDLGAGVMGLVHLTELGYGRIADVAGAFPIGDRVSVKILRLDESSGKISLSIRQAAPDPWESTKDRFHAGDRVTGRVLRLTDFGAFVEVAEGIEALAPAREFPPTTGGWRTGLEGGAVREWTVLAVDPSRRRISLAPAQAEGTGTAPIALEPGQRVTGRVQRVETFGIFVWLSQGQVGLVPTALSGTPRGTDLARRFAVGQEVEAEVLEITEEGRRIRLSMQPADRPRGTPSPRPESSPRPAPRPAREEAEPPAQGTPGTFGTSLGDALRAALDKRDQT